MTETAPADAPCEIPRTKGSARGFFVKACMTIPQSVNPAPTIHAVKMRGRRMFQMIDLVLSSHVTGTTACPVS